MIRLQDYWIAPDGARRDEMYALRLTPQIREAAARTVQLADQLLASYVHARGALPMHPNGTHVSSGWRPPEVNATTAGAAVNSKHMTGHAIDVYDPEGDLDDWLMTKAGQAALAALGLWMEHPSATKGWCHLQTLPPRSKKRVFYP